MKRLSSADLEFTTRSEVVEAELEKLDFSDPAQAALGHKLLEAVGFLGAVAGWSRVTKEER